MQDFHAPKMPPTATSVLCPGCGYNLTGVLIGGNCPECGRVVGQVLQPNQTTSNWAVVSLIMGIISIAGGCPSYGLLSVLCGPLAIIFAVLGYRDVRQLKASPSSHGLATGGLVCGIIGCCMAALGVLLVVIVIIGA